MSFRFRSPGFGLTLVAETTTGVFVCSELTSNPQGSPDGPTVPEDLGRDTAVMLLAEIFRVRIKSMHNFAVKLPEKN